MTTPASPLPVSAVDIWNEFSPTVTTLSGTVTGTDPEWTLSFLGGDLSAYIGYKIREPSTAGRVGTITATTYSGGYYGFSTATVTFTMPGAKPGGGAGLLGVGPRYSIFPPISNGGLGSYYAGGGVVPAGTYGFPTVGTRSFIPTSGNPISYRAFRGAYTIQSFSVAAPYTNLGGSVSRSNVIYIPPGPWRVMTRLQGGGGGGGGADGNGGAGGGDGAGLVATFYLNATTSGYLTIYVGRGGTFGGSGGTTATFNGGQSAAAGQFGGAYDNIFNGGHGGTPGPAGSSGFGGGGGAASCLIWTKDSSDTNTAELLAFAGGGGGGSGAGQSSLIVGYPETVAWPNKRNRFFTSSIPDLITLNQQPDIWQGGAGKSAYRRAGSGSDGQGWNTMTNYYPPGAEAYAGYDGGAGGGGGGGNGYGGGLTGSADGTIVWSNYKGTWYPAYEFTGEGGGQGFVYVNFNYYTGYGYSTGVGSAATYGSGTGVGATAAIPANSGLDGAAWLKVTNDFYDSTYP